MNQFVERLKRLTSQGRLVPKASDPSGFFWTQMHLKHQLIGAAQFQAILLKQKFLDGYMDGNFMNRKGVSSGWGALNNNSGPDTSLSRKVLVVISAAANAGAKEVLLVVNDSLGKNPLDFRCVETYSWDPGNNSFNW
jgi:hypothetical protein